MKWRWKEENWIIYRWNISIVAIEWHFVSDVEPTWNDDFYLLVFWFRNYNYTHIAYFFFIMNPTIESFFGTSKAHWNVGASALYSYLIGNNTILAGLVTVEKRKKKKQKVFSTLLPHSHSLHLNAHSQMNYAFVWSSTVCRWKSTQ